MAQLPARGSSGEERVLNHAVVERFASSLKGKLITPADEEYEQARGIWNGMIDRRPAMIAQCAGTADVVEAVAFASQHGLLVAVRGGGHNVAGFATCDGGLVIDLSLMNAVHVNPEARLARVQGGARWADLDAATQAHGLATPGGLVSDTGIAGLTLAGGLGWLRNMYGLSCDNLVAADLVIAGGQLVRVSETENPDLLWGLRGGGGNFGVVTSFEYRLHPVGPMVAACFVTYHADRLREGLRFFRQYTQSAPDEVGAVAVRGVFPTGNEAYPAEVHGLPFLGFASVYAGPPEEGEAVLRPLREFGDPLLDLSGTAPYVDFQKVFDEDYPAHILRYYWKSVNLLELSDEAIDVIARNAALQPSPLSTTDIWHLGGALARVPEDATAFSGRGVSYMVTPEANWADPKDDEANIGWSRRFVAEMKPFAHTSQYLNFPGFLEDGDQTMRSTFGDKYARLAELKRKYDPTNLFRLNQNIKPAGGG